MSVQTRRDILQYLAPQYQQASSAERNTLVDEFTAMTGYHRKYARWLLNHAEAIQQTAVCQDKRYGPEVQQALLLAWNTANRVCAKRLIPFLPTLIDALERHGHLRLSEESRRCWLSMSVATADRLLRAPRHTGKRGLSTTQADFHLGKEAHPHTFPRSRVENSDRPASAWGSRFVSARLMTSVLLEIDESICSKTMNTLETALYGQRKTREKRV